MLGAAVMKAMRKSFRHVRVITLTTSLTVCLSTGFCKASVTLFYASLRIVTLELVNFYVAVTTIKSC